MDMTDATKLAMFRLSMDDKILSYFDVRGPLTMRAAPVQVIFADFSDGLDVNISTNTSCEHAAARNDRELCKILRLQGEDAGEDLMTFLANSGRFEQYIRSRWWFRLYYRVKRIFFSIPLDLGRFVVYNTYGRFVRRWANAMHYPYGVAR